MQKLVITELPPVARTLLIPLAYRAIESQRSDALLRDERAVELINKFDKSFFQAAKRNNMEQTATMMRARQFDKYAENYLSNYPAASVIDIGCGLDSRFDRIDNGVTNWYGLDFPEVIQLRQRLLPTMEREHLIAGSALDFVWMEMVKALPAIILAEGVSPYLAESEGKQLVLALAQHFPGSELVFDALNPLSIWMHKLNPALRKTGARLRWGLRNGKVLEEWDADIRLLEEWFYFDHEEPRLGVYNLLRYLPLLARANYIVRYQLGENTKNPPKTMISSHQN